METAAQLASRLSQASIKKFYDVYRRFDWPERLDESRWHLSPELVSIHGTPVWDGLDAARQRRLSLHELVNFFSFVLQGERPLVEGVSQRVYTKAHDDPDVCEYLHHFLDEENKHMVMFATFCRRYAGKIYPEKKIELRQDLSRGEEDIRFFLKVLVVEELGDVYNVEMAKDDRLDPIVREINHTHHCDEARHIIFGRRYLKELFDRHVEQWAPGELATFRAWVVDYLDAAWRDFYNPSVYKDAGLEDPYGVRQAALAHPACRAHRNRVSGKLLAYLVDAGILLEEPVLA